MTDIQFAQLLELGWAAGCVVAYALGMIAGYQP